MKSFIFLPLTLFALKVAACNYYGDYCDDSGARQCECDQGVLIECELYLVPEVDGEGGESYALWTYVEDCPVPADGGLQCVIGSGGEAECNTA